MIGQTLRHYHISSLLGVGGMGEVYRARDTKLGREVAISGKVKVLDFGLAKALVPLPPAQQSVGPHGTIKILATQSGAVMGTPAYMSPEQADGQPLDARSDVFSFGAVLYEMLAGQRAFGGDSLGATLSAVLRDEPKPLRELAPEIPPEIDSVVVRCLRKDRTQRFQTMAEVVELLRRTPREVAKEIAPSLAVLPFVNMSDDRENEFLADGITEDLITALSRVQGLRVPARTSSFAFKGKNEDIRRIGQLLSVETVLEGSVRKSGAKLRVTAQLVKVRDGFHLWSERYDREMKDVFDIQDDITRAIVGALEVQLVGGAQTPFVRRQTASTEAYELYVKGRIFWNQRGAGLKKALHYFELALLEDPNCALALSGLADAYHMLAIHDVFPCRDALLKAMEAAQKSVALDPLSAEAHCSLGWLLQMLNWDMPGAEREFLRALELNPNYLPARYWYAPHLSACGRDAECLTQYRLAVQQDPLSALAHLHLGWGLFSLRRFDEALLSLRRSLELDAQNFFARWLLGRVCWFTGQREFALAELQRAADLSGRISPMLSSLGWALALSGETGRAREIQRELTERTTPTPTRPLFLANLHVAFGESDLAFAALERALAERELWLLWVPVRHSLVELWPLESDPRWPEFVAKVEAAVRANSTSNP